MSDGMFGGVHGPVNAWKSEEGSMLAPHEAGPLLSGNTGDPRFNGVAGSIGWASKVLVSTPLTRGGGTMAK